MKRVLLIAFAVALVTAVSAPAVIAGTNPNVVFTLHAKSHTTKGVCTTASPNNGTPIPCTSYVTNWGLGGADVYLVAARGNPVTGIAGLSCGIWYAGAPGVGVDVYTWTLCADLEFTNAGANGEWPESGGGNRITWASDVNCQRTTAGSENVHAVAGAFYVYAYGYDRMGITPNMNLAGPDELAVADCDASTDFLLFSRAAFVTFSASGSELGCNPCTEPDIECESVATEPTTWGKIKSKYGSN